MKTSGEILRELLRGYTKRDDGRFRAAAMALIQGERAKNHRLLADDLEKILVNGNGGVKTEVAASFYRQEVPKDRERGFALADVRQFHFDWTRFVLNQKTEGILREIVREYEKKDLLASSGLRPTQRVLFYGPPGCGKTLAAQVLASVLGSPLVTVRFDAIVSSYLGETAANLRRVFEFVERGEWVVLFDEFDAIGKDRDNPLEHGELKRVVNTLLQLMDAYRGESLFIAATNHENLLDRAIWRRFDAVAHFPLPSQQERILMMRQFLRGFDYSDIDFSSFVRRTKGATGADIELFAVNAARRAVLDGRSAITPSDVESALSWLQERMTVALQASSSQICNPAVRSGDSDPTQQDAS